MTTFARGPRGRRVSVKGAAMGTVARRWALVVATATLPLLAGCTATGDTTAGTSSETESLAEIAGVDPADGMVELDAGVGVENGDFTSEPAVARSATMAVADELMGETPERVLLRPEQPLEVPHGWTVEFDPATWERVGDIARVQATADAAAFVVWLVRDDDRWLLSHTSAPGTLSQVSP